MAIANSLAGQIAYRRRTKRWDIGVIASFAAFDGSAETIASAVIESAPAPSAESRDHAAKCLASVSPVRQLSRVTPQSAWHMTAASVLKGLISNTSIG
jgi:hypothetical protein